MPLLQQLPAQAPVLTDGAWGTELQMRGMRAATGALSEVHVPERRLHCRLLGNIATRGICGSGLVDAAASGLNLGLIQSSGRLSTAR